MDKSSLIIDKLIEIDDTGMPVAPNLRNLLDEDVRALYRRDKSKNKERYTAECIVIYYLGDPKSPARQSGLSDAEALVMAIKQAGLESDYLPDPLVQRLIERYYQQNITEAGRVVENINKGIHNINLSITAMNKLLADKLKGQITLEEIPTIVAMVDNINKKAGELPSILKKLDEAKENLIYEKETKLSRGGNTVLSSMDADGY